MAKLVQIRYDARRNIESQKITNFGGQVNEAKAFYLFPVCADAGWLRQFCDYHQ
ncbi:MAG TPA: hypothetical protein PLB10_08130 [Thiolinea sp.]|nr:hypothetical protein [Thiolinea sp.]